MKPEGNPEEQLCQPKENPVHPDSFFGFPFYLKLDILVTILNFSNIDVTGLLGYWVTGIGLLCGTKNSVLAFLKCMDGSFYLK